MIRTFPLMVAVPWSRWQAHTAAMAALGRSVERARRAHPSSSGPMDEAVAS